MEKQDGEYRARFLASKVHCATLAQHLERSKDTKVHFRYSRPPYWTAPPVESAGVAEAGGPCDLARRRECDGPSDAEGPSHIVAASGPWVWRPGRLRLAAVKAWPNRGVGLLVVAGGRVLAVVLRAGGAVVGGSVGARAGDRRGPGGRGQA